MVDIEKAQAHYSNLAAFVADVDLWCTQAEGEDEEKALDAIRLLAARLTKKVRNHIAETCYRQQFGGDGGKAEVAAPAAKAKAGVRVLKEGEEA